MDELKNTAKLVKKILEKDNHARNNDDYLYYLVCKEILQKNGIDIKTIPFETALLWRKVYKLPPFETVRRARQKIQAEIPELASTIKVQKAREEKITDFRGFALSNITAERGL